MKREKMKKDLEALLKDRQEMFEITKKGLYDALERYKQWGLKEDDKYVVEVKERQEDLLLNIKKQINGFNKLLEEIESGNIIIEE
ncbi:hypothetical protein ACSW9K_08220 [Clostridium perfringens]